ncbi:MAG: 16S rRNA (guanine(527)-N(7))-methyltransferase RsmG [Ferruginibacter sp.]
MEIIKKYFSDFTPSQEKQFAALQDLYKEWNEKINVISRKDMDNFYTHHVLHSLAIATRFKLDGLKIMDLGCGGGFPGIPLAIFFPGAHFHMVDSINKKLTVVKAIAEAIGLSNITTQHTRAESLAQNQYDAVVTRAVAPLKDLWHWSKPLIKKNKKIADEPNGLISLKGGDLTQEIFVSGCKPFVWEIESTFLDPWFKAKFLLYQPR